MRIAVFSGFQPISICSEYFQICFHDVYWSNIQKVSKVFVLSNYEGPGCFEGKLSQNIIITNLKSLERNYLASAQSEKQSCNGVGGGEGCER
jgi:hypothetical protein